MREEGSGADVKKVSLNELKTKLDGGSAVILIETLSPDEYKRGHLPGAVNIPSNQIAELSGSVLPDKSAEIVLYCSGPKCQASENAPESWNSSGIQTSPYTPRAGRAG